MNATKLMFKKENKTSKENQIIESKIVSFALNLSLAYLATVLFATVVHLNSKPINREDLALATANQYTPINIAARHYIYEENAIRLITASGLCGLTPKFYKESMFDKTDYEICNYSKGSGRVAAWLNGRLPQ